MASKDTNGTILTLGVVAVGAFIAYQFFGKKRPVQAASGVGGAGGVPDYYSPYAAGGAAPYANPLLGKLSLTGGAQAPATPGLGGSSDSAQSILDSIFKTDDSISGISNPEFGGDSLDTTSGAYGSESGLSASDFSIPLEETQLYDNPGTFITGANDGSADAYTSANADYADTSGISLDAPLQEASFDGSNDDTVDTGDYEGE